MSAPVPRKKYVCQTCNKEFLGYESRPRVYCSLQCRYKAQQGRYRAPRVEFICPICGKPFFDRAARIRTYCSRKCKGKARTATANLVHSPCAFCGSEFIAQSAAGWNDREQQRYCSRSCSGKDIAQTQRLHLRSNQTFICEYCGNPFTRKARHDRTYRFCSRECHWSYNTGENNCSWQGGTDRNYGSNWKHQRRKALKRDAYTCQECGVIEDGVHVHHIVPRITFDNDWKAMNKLSNLVTLCPSCHGKEHACRQ